ncbi:MAG: SagB family peptide dehydrogenase [Candidatus Tectomicrobia bacterium]|nr:SagB family peptide dehydrogenase [Candidatus Tectomicrobia bacterium]
MSDLSIGVLTFSEWAHIGPDDPLVSPGLQAVVKCLCNGGGTRDELRDQVWRLDGETGLARFYYVLAQWSAAGLLGHTLVSEGEPLVTWVPLAPGAVFGLTPLKPDTAYVLSRFAYSRREGAQWVLESSRCAVQLRLHDGRGAQVLAQLSTPQTAQDLVAALSELGSETVETFSALLHQVGMLSEVTTDGRTLEETALPLATWEFHDLLFHSRSRVGRHANPVGSTYRFADEIEPLPAVKPSMSANPIPLNVSDLAALAETDMPLSRVLEARSSIREHGESPISIEQLGSFLYRVARVRQLIDTPYGQLSSRPYPGGGAIYELELYLLVQRCTDLSPGLYHYDPLHHQLEPLGAPTPDTEALLHDAMAATGWEPEQPPQVLILVSARFARVSWKYASMAYAVILKHVGVLVQTMYLVATAMGLAPCAIGAGDADRFAQAVGTEYEAETSVGEFLLGSRSEAEA